MINIGYHMRGEVISVLSLERVRRCHILSRVSAANAETELRERKNGNRITEKRVKGGKKVKGGKAEKRVKGGKAEKRVKGGNKSKRRKKR